MHTDQQLLTTKEASALLGVCVAWMCQKRKQIGAGPDFFRIGKKILYSKQEVERWRESRRNAGQIQA